MLISLIALAAATQAADLPAPEATADTDVVVTATGVEQPSDEVGQAVTIVTRAALDRRQTISLADYLATTPGVTVSRNGGPGSFTAVRIRGAEAEQTLTLIDGVRVNDPSSPGGGFDFGNLLSASVERVEVLRGANSVRWGSQAIGGVVNVVTTPPTETMTGRAQAEYGYADSGFATAALSGGTGPVRASITGGYLRSDGISAAAVGTERDGYRQYGATGRVIVEPVAGIGADLRLYYADSRLEIDGFPAPTYTLADTAEFSKTREFYGHAGLFANVADGRLRNRLSFTFADIDRDNFDSAFGAAPSFFGRGRSERYEYQGDFAVTDRVRLIAGAEHEDSRFTDGSPRRSTGVSSGYGQSVVTPIAALTLTGGVRYDDHADFGDRTTFGGNAVVRIASGTRLRATYAEGFKAPTLFQLFSAFGDPDLRPESAKSYDVGVEQRLLGATFGLTYFRRRTINQIDFDLNTFTYQNIARARAGGIEATVALTPTPRLTVLANYSYIRAENRSPGAVGNDLARRPRDTVSVSVDWRSPFGVAVGGTVTVVGDSFDNAANTVRIDGHALASIRAELPIGDRFALYGRMENLFDADYRTVARYGTPGRAGYAGVRLRFD